MEIEKNINNIKNIIGNYCRLVAISKTKPVELILEAYNSGQRIFGENKVQELEEKHLLLPKDIQWHMVGHLQTNKVKYIAPFITLIHSVDSEKLLKEINKQALKNNRTIDVLFQVYIANETTKFGWDKDELLEFLRSEKILQYKNINIAGLMGMATNTDDLKTIRTEFRSLKNLFEFIRNNFSLANMDLKEISMGMSGDYKIAVEEGSTLVRVGSSIFGSR
ncbi:MAG: YggS family pyridoxal phosphate-dependent enzyme [Cyclobacteriaceae bacterium]|nr:YggS family pyridoxal phosphate-dependent enzyme [Cyclobacteriaceae bacterium]